MACCDVVSGVASYGGGGATSGGGSYDSVSWKSISWSKTNMMVVMMRCGSHSAEASQCFGRHQQFF